MKVRWCTEKDHGDSHYWCEGCSGLSKEAFIIYKMRGDLVFCLKCMQELQAVISPLTLLVQTGKDTLEGR